MADRPDSDPAGPHGADGAISAIVQAVRAGDDEQIREQLALLAVRADVPVLYALRDALAKDLDAGVSRSPGASARAGRK